MENVTDFLVLTWLHCLMANKSWRFILLLNSSFLKNSSDILFKTYPVKKRVHAFPKCICPKVNIAAEWSSKSHTSRSPANIFAIALLGLFCPTPSFG